MRLPTETSRWPSASRLLPSCRRADRAGRFFAAAGGAAEFRGDQPGAGGRPFGALGEQAAARGAFGDARRAAAPTAPAARRRPGPELLRVWPPCPSGARRRRACCRAAQRRRAAGDRARADHRPHPGLRRRSAAASGASSASPAPVGDRTPFGGGDEDERRLPAGADRAVDRLGALRAPGWSSAARRCPGAPVVKPSTGRISSSKRHRDQARRRARGCAAPRRPRRRRSSVRRTARRRADPAGVDPRAEQRPAAAAPRGSR